MRVLALLALCFAAVAAVPSNPQRIVGGSVTTIEQYPTIAALLQMFFGLYTQSCGGTILNSRSILTAAQCTANLTLGNMRIRVGSTWANSGGVVHTVYANIVHPSYDYRIMDNDIAILRSPTTFSFNNNVQPASIAGANYNLPDNQAVWFAGWGVTSEGGPASEQLRHVELVIANQVQCRNSYTHLATITDNMLCSGWPIFGDIRDLCQGDSGSPLYHNGIVVGVFSFNLACGWGVHPSVNTRVSRYTSWIQSNA